MLVALQVLASLWGVSAGGRSPVAGRLLDSIMSIGFCLPDVDYSALGETIVDTLALLVDT